MLGYDSVSCPASVTLNEAGFVLCWQLAGKVEPKEIQPGVGVAMVSGLLVANDNQYTLQVRAYYLLPVIISCVL